MNDGHAGAYRQLPVGMVVSNGALRGGLAGAVSGPVLVVLWAAFYGLASATFNAVPGEQYGGSSVASTVAEGFFYAMYAAVPAAFIGSVVGVVVGLGSSIGAIVAVVAEWRWRNTPDAPSGLATLPAWPTTAIGGALGGVGTAVLILSQFGIFDGVTWALCLVWVAGVSAWQSSRAMRIVLLREDWGDPNPPVAAAEPRSDPSQPAPVAHRPKREDPFHLDAYGPDTYDADTYDAPDPQARGSHGASGDSLGEWPSVQAPARIPRTPVQSGRLSVLLGCIPAFVAVVMATIAAIRVTVNNGGYSCGNGGYVGPTDDGTSEIYNFSSGFFPPQRTCVYDSGTVVEMMPTHYMVIVAILAVIGAVLLQKGVSQLVRAQLAFRESAEANGPTVSSTSIRVVALNRIVFALLALAICLLLAVSHIIGAVTPTPEFDPGKISAESREHPQPAPPAPDPLDDPALPSPYVPDPVTAPQVVTSLSTYYTLAELTAAMQFLVDSSMDTAGPIDDPSIPPGTRV
ncbi:MAG: hypothetical protein JWQ43_3852, partial [Glaciihabitans sp.]|nr:hypothetical protein [Glaciihabitans sp.]